MMRHARGGFSLMEVMLATSILLGSSVVLIELATIGRKQANSAYDLNLAQLLCQAKLDEIIAGVASGDGMEEQELEDNPGWFYTVESLPLRRQNLVAVKVSVFQEEQESRRAVRFSLVRWLPESTLRSDGFSPNGSSSPTSSSSGLNTTGSSASTSSNSPRRGASTEVQP